MESETEKTPPPTRFRHHFLIKAIQYAACVPYVRIQNKTFKKACPETTLTLLRIFKKSQLLPQHEQENPKSGIIW